MIDLLLPLAALDSAAAPVTRAQPGWLWNVEGTIAVTVAVLLIVLLAALALMAWRLSRTFERLGAVIEKFREDLRPVTESAAAITGHLEEAASSVRSAVDGVTDTIHRANDTLRDAVDTADARFREFDAIVRVARDEAEDAVVGAASVMRGVRGGVSAFRRHGPPPAGPADEADEDAADAPPNLPPARRSGGPRVRRPRARDTE